MSYVKHTWETGEVIDAEKLNNLETGVESAGGADWDAEEGEKGFIENKPFESHIEDVPGLPHAYMDNLSVILNEDLIDRLGWSAEDWESEFGISREKCFMSSGLILNYTQAKGCYSFTHEGTPYPGDEAIIEEYGSVQAFGEAMAAAIVSFMHLSVPCTYIGDFNYVTGNLPNITSLKNPVYSSEVYGNEESSCPVTISVNSLSPTPETPEFTTNHVDIWGNTGILRGYAPGLFQQIFDDEEFTMPICGQVNHPTSDKFYFAITTISYMGAYPIYWYDLVFTDNKYFGKDPGGTAPVPCDWEEVEGAPTGYKRYQFWKGGEIDGREPEITLEVSSFGEYDIHWGVYGYGMLAVYPGSLHVYYEDTYVTHSPNPMDSTKKLYSGTDTIDLQSNKQIKAVCSSVAEGPDDTYMYVDVPEDWTIVTEKEGYIYSSSFDYTLESAEKEIVKQIESKFIEKPVWWFGDKEVIISEPTHLITNAGMYMGGY